MRNRAPHRLTVVALALIAPSLALSACGGSRSGGSASGILQQAFHPSEQISSARLALALRLSATGLKTGSAPESVQLAGPFQNVGTGQLPRFHLTTTVVGGGRSLVTGEVYTGSQLFLQLEGHSFVAPSSELVELRQGYAQAAKKPGASSQTSFATLGIDPSTWLTQPVIAGEQTIAGVQTIHISAGLNVPHFLADLTGGGTKGSAGAGSLVSGLESTLSAAQSAALAKSITAAHVDVYAGKSDHVLRQLTVSAAIDTPPSARAALGGLRTGTLTLRLAFSAINQHQSIVAPAGAQPLSVLVSALRRVEGGAATSSSSSTPASPPSSSNQTAYLACTKRAGGDLAKLEKCAPLLSGG